MGGIDWAGCKARYTLLVARVATRGEMADVLHEMVTELGTSHCYENDGDYGSTRDRAHSQAQGSLGVDTAWDAETQAYRVLHVVRGDTWDEERCGPLATLGMNVEAGSFITALNRRRLTEGYSLESALRGKENKEVFVSIIDEHEKQKRVKELAEAIAAARALELIVEDEGKTKGKKGKQKAARNDKGAKGSKKNKGKGAKMVGRTVRAKAAGLDQVLSARWAHECIAWHVPVERGRQGLTGSAVRGIGTGSRPTAALSTKRARAEWGMCMCQRCVEWGMASSIAATSQRPATPAAMPPRHCCRGHNCDT